MIFLRFVIALAVTTATLTGCGGSQPPVGATSALMAAAHGTRTFKYTGAKQEFKVPSGVSSITVKASGASGPYGEISGACTLNGGIGGLVQATIAVRAGETLAVFVGGEGEIGATCGSQSGNGSGGFNGGGNGGSSSDYGNYDYDGDGGGGASDLREGGSDLANRVVVAAGGGGGGGNSFNAGEGGGGAGGGKVGGRGGGGDGGSGFGIGYGGRGGAQNKGGAGGGGGHGGYKRGSHAKDGALGNGGAGGGGKSYDTAGGGGGGGGYYGGGGGGAGAATTSGGGTGGGGGGGSSYAESGATNVKYQKGAAHPGSGQIVISW